MQNLLKRLAISLFYKDYHIYCKIFSNIIILKGTIKKDLTLNFLITSLLFLVQLLYYFESIISHYFLIDSIFKVYPSGIKSLINVFICGEHLKLSILAISGCLTLHI